MDELQEQQNNSDRLKPYQFKKGQSGNPNGRPVGKSVKERAQAMLRGMSDDEFEEFLHGIDKKTVWEMAEGKAKQDMELSGSLSISEVLNKLENGQQTVGQRMENEPSIQDTQQESGADNI